MIIRLKLDMKKVDKSKLFHSEKTSAVYLNVTLLENKNGVDEFGNHFMAVQDVSKEDRLAGIKGAILGNGKIPKKENNTEQAEKPAEKPAVKPSTDVEIW